jgi:hypothetical protein
MKSDSLNIVSKVKIDLASKPSPRSVDIGGSTPPYPQKSPIPAQRRAMKRPRDQAILDGNCVIRAVTRRHGIQVFDSGDRETHRI